jgi:hypothetical protein
MMILSLKTHLKYSLGCYEDEKMDGFFLNAIESEFFMYNP